MPAALLTSAFLATISQVQGKFTLMLNVRATYILKRLVLKNPLSLCRSRWCEAYANPLPRRNTYFFISSSDESWHFTYFYHFTQCIGIIHTNK